MDKTAHTPSQRQARTTFYIVLANNLIASIINFTVWFAITFFVYLQTRSVFATAVISGIYLVMTAVSGIWFGSLVDHYRKKNIMIASSAASLVLYAACFAIYQMSDPGTFKDPASLTLWIFVTLLMSGVIIGNIRAIAQPTLVTLLIPADERDKANGLSGTIWGTSFLVTSVISGFLVGHSGMFTVLLAAIVITLAAIIHLCMVTIPENKIVHSEERPKKVDIRGTLVAIRAVPGLLALIFFTTFNNFLGGVFMALMDAYGLSLVSVEIWGLLWGGVSLGFIVGGLVIAKCGLGKNPLRSLFIANILIWIIASVFTIQASIILLIVGMFMYFCVMPFIEASEQTIIQRVVPPERQGRVFGFAQSIEQAASPLTAFLIGPITQFFFIPFMTDGAGVDLIGGWFGTGPNRGIALAFTVTGLIGLCITLWAMASKQYRQLSGYYLSNK